MSIDIPRRKYANGERVMFSMRINKKLLDKLKKIGAKNGYSCTFIIETAVDAAIKEYEKKK